MCIRDSPGPDQAQRRRLVVLHVQIDARRGGENDFGSLRGGGGGVAGRPVLGYGRRRQMRLPDLLPADHALAVAGDDGRHPLDEAHVVSLVRGQRLVAADVEVVAGRQRRQFANHVVDEPVGDLPVDEMCIRDRSCACS